MLQRFHLHAILAHPVTYDSTDFTAVTYPSRHSFFSSCRPANFSNRNAERDNRQPLARRGSAFQSFLEDEGELGRRRGVVVARPVHVCAHGGGGVLEGSVEALVDDDDVNLVSKSSLGKAVERSVAAEPFRRHPRRRAAWGSVSGLLLVVMPRSCRN